MKTLTFLNQKGGVWKTTTAVTVAHGLALQGRDVLLVDLDAQGNVADALGMSALKKSGEADGLYELLIRERGLQAVRPSGRPRLDVILGHKKTLQAKQILAGMDFREYLLRNALAEIASEYDVCLLDVAPGVDVLQIGALVAADFFVIPVALSHLAVVGAMDALGTVVSLQKVGAFRGKFLGVLPTHWERQTNESDLQLRAMAQQFKRLVWPAIPMDPRAKEAPRLGKTLWEYAPKGRAIRGIRINDKYHGGYQRGLARLVQEVGL